MKTVAILSLISLGLIAIVPVTVRAFFPTNLKTVGGLLGTSHMKITDDAIQELDQEFFGVTNLTSSMKKARKQISEANAEVDKDQKTAAKHFDGESFPEGQCRLVGGCSGEAGLLPGIIDGLNANNAQGARDKLGQALHTIQDFYSHSNWVELGFGFPNPDLGRPSGVLTRLPKTTATCKDCTGGLPPILCPDCSSNVITDKLTSGYYGGENAPFGTKPPGKCSHGGALDSSATGLFGQGINKDSTDCEFSPHNFLHATAVSLAKEATKQFIRDIKDQVTPRQLKLLLGVGPTLTIVMDTTGSMGSIIESVKTQAIQIVNGRLGTDEEPSKYVLAPFNDPFTGPLTVTTDAAVFKNAISSLFASGGGDCPELANTGMLQGLAASDEGGDLFMFTDASAKDDNLASNVSSLATSKDIKIFPILFGSCSPVDPAFIRAASESGGQLFFLQRSEAGNITKLADVIVRSNAVNILSIEDTLAGTAKTYTIPVDSAMTRLGVSISGTSTVTVTRADGTTVQPTDPDASFTLLSSGVVLAITNPAVGNWIVTVNGTGSFSLAVTGTSTLDLTSFKFVEPGGRPGHEGLFPISGLPVVNQKTVADATMDGLFSTAQFQLRAKDGALLQSLSLSSGSGALGDVPANEFSGTLNLPSTSFVIYVTGTDVSGKGFQRVLPATVKPQTLSIVKPGAVDLHTGQTTTYVFTVLNVGTSDTLRVSASDDRGFVRTVSPANFSLGSNGIQDVAVQLQTPTGVSAGSSDTLTFTVESTGGSGATNFAVLTSFVSGVSNLPPVANAGPDQTVECASQGGTLVVLDGSASNDPDGDTLAFQWTDENGNSLSGGNNAVVNHLLVPLGSHIFFLTVTDPGGLSSTAAMHVIVRDSAPPKLSLSILPSVLWPPDHKLDLVTTSIQVSDVCDASPAVALTSIVSSEFAGIPGAGNTPKDIEAANGGAIAFGTDVRSFLLRAERSGTGIGRIYTVTYQASDASGNKVSAATQIVVPHDQAP